MIQILDSGVIFRNPLPSIQSLQAQFPGFCHLSDREILCIYKRGSAPASVDASWAKARSLDGGVTWTAEGLVRDRSLDDRLYSYVYAYPIRLSSGELLLAGSRWDRSESDADFNIYNPETLGAVPCETLVLRSPDGGRNWGEPQVIAPPPGIPMMNASGRILPLRDGRLLLPVETWKCWDDTGPVKQRSMALFSGDQGRTWDEHITVAFDTDLRILYWNGMFTRLESGRILVMYWGKDTATEQDLPIPATSSLDEGRTWDKPHDTGIVGQMGCTIDAGHGRVLAVYNRRDEESPGVRAVLSSDEGRTWPRNGHTTLWDARGRAAYGSGDDDNRSRSIYDEGTMAFGKPDAVRLADGSFLIGYWCCADFVMHLRYARVEVG